MLSQPYKQKAAIARDAELVFGGGCAQPVGYSKKLPGLLEPASSEELRDALRSAADAKRPIELFGRNSKRAMAGPVSEGSVPISTAGMRRILQYEPRDLTVSVEPGIPLAELNVELARHGQTIPLDGPYSEEATVGGVVAANVSGSRRRLCGTARDLVIGMTFVTLDGKVVQTGGMVVKNVAGLDMGKLMIGSFGTLAAIASVNFKLLPRARMTRTVVFSFETLAAAVEVRNAAIRGVLNPVAVDILNPVFSAQLPPQLGLRNFTLALMFAGSQPVIDRSLREAAAFGSGRVLQAHEEQRFWSALDSATPRFLEKFREGAVVRMAVSLADCAAALEAVDGPGHAHAASGIVRGWFTRPDAAARCIAGAVKRGHRAVVEFSSTAARQQLTLWPEPGGDFVVMERIKRMFDPGRLLNRGRLFGRI